MPRFGELMSLSKSFAPKKSIQKIDEFFSSIRHCTKMGHDAGYQSDTIFSSVK
jgi:hypothetical protein